MGYLDMLGKSGERVVKRGHIVDREQEEGNKDIFLSLPLIFLLTCLNFAIKDEVEFWSCDCIVKEMVWNRPEKVDHLAYKNLCVLQGSGIIKMIRNLAKSW